MAGNITVLPQRKNALDYAEPYIQLAFQMALKKQMEDKQMEQNLKQAQTMFPEAFTPTLNAAGQKQYDFSQVSPSMQGEAMSQAMPTIPEKYKTMAFNPETAQKYPGLGMNFQTGAMEYKVPSNYGTMPIININQEGKPEQIGTAPRNAKILTPSQMETPSQKQQRDIETTQKKKSQEVSGEMKSIDNMIDVVWKQADALIPAQEGLSQAATTGLGRKFGTTIPGRILGMGNENAVAFSEFQEGTLSMLIRSLGEKGMLTDQDIKRARQFEPSFYDTPTIRKLKRNSMAEFLKSKVSAYTSGETQQGVPQVGQSFNGEKVLNVKRIE